MANILMMIIYNILAIFGLIYQPQIEYKVVQKYEGFELREYPSFYVASTNDPSDHTGFLTIAQYIGLFSPLIKPANDHKMQIPLGSPIIGNQTVLSFYLPLNQTLPPLPTDFKVYLQQIRPQKYFVWSFNGNLARQDFVDKVQHYYQILNNHGFKAGQDWQFARYNVEWCIFKFRRNELWIQALDNYHFYDDVQLQQ